MLLRPWDSPGRNAGVGNHFLLQGTFLLYGSTTDCLSIHPLMDFGSCFHLLATVNGATVNTGVHLPV